MKWYVLLNLLLKNKALSSKVLDSIDFHTFVLYNIIMFNRTCKTLFVLVEHIIDEVRTYGKIKKGQGHRGNLCNGAMCRQLRKYFDCTVSLLHLHSEWRKDYSFLFFKEDFNQDSVRIRKPLLPQAFYQYFHSLLRQADRY